MDTEIRFEPTLFMFLGTSPAQIGWRLKRLNQQAYGDVPVLRYFWADTDGTLDPTVARWFSSSERVDLSGFNGDEVLANINLYPAIRSWWPTETRLKPGFIRRGANQVRLFGRLALFRMFNDRTSGEAFVDKLRSHLDALQQIEHIDATERRGKNGLRYIVERGGVRVVCFYTTCGATGSSIVHDVAYLCRHLLRNTNSTLVGVALLPPVMDKAIKNETHNQWEKIRANTYAWFKENEYLLAHPYWRVSYPEGAPVQIAAPPFDLNFVIDIGNQAGDRLSLEDDVFSMVAQAIFLDTGSSIGGAMRGFNANVSVLMEEFQGRQRAYSSLAAASLVYPAEKILGYARARLSQSIIQQGFLGTPDPLQVNETASSLLGRLELRDIKLVANLLEGRQIVETNGPAIRKNTEVAAIRKLLAAQEKQDAQELNHQVKLITGQAVATLARAKDALSKEVMQILLERGVRFAQAVLTTLAETTEVSTVANGDTLSVSGLKLRLAQVGVSEIDLEHARQEYATAWERLGNLDGEAWQALWRTLAKRSWQKELDRTRSDCLHWLTEANQLALQLAAQREVANLYDQVLDQIRVLQATLAGIAQTASRAVEHLEQAAQENLKPSGLEQGIYELSLEAVDAEYIRKYYLQHKVSVDPDATFQAFSRTLNLDNLGVLRSWSESELASRLMDHCCIYFAPEIESTSLLEALDAYYGDHAPQIIEALFDRLVRYCHPFWQYARDSGIQGHEGKSLIGVEDEHSVLIPDKYRNSLQYEIKSTGFKHRIDVARVQHGLPAFLLRGMADYKAYYDARRKGLDPLHVLPEAGSAEEVIPEERQESRWMFAIACAFGHVVQIGSWYYFDPGKEYASHHIHPGRENRLGQGRENAEEAFIQRDDMVRMAERLIEAEIISMGNRAAIHLLEGQIGEARQALANMSMASSAENGLRQQYEKEIRALIEKQRQLGHIPHTLEKAG